MDICARQTRLIIVILVYSVALLLALVCLVGSVMVFEVSMKNIEEPLYIGDRFLATPLDAMKITMGVTELLTVAFLLIELGMHLVFCQFIFLGIKVDITSTAVSCMELFGTIWRCVTSIVYLVVFVQAQILINLETRGILVFALIYSFLQIASILSWCCYCRTSCGVLFSMQRNDKRGIEND